jgi:1-acyl-sn-glycerol-3-phosphate acyltransferase
MHGVGAFFRQRQLLPDLLTDRRINASQFLGAPLYLVNRDWYNSWIAFTKQSWGLLTMTMTQWWAPTIVRVSGDSTMRGQLLQTTDGQLICNFPERMVLIANHQIYTDWLYLWWVGYAAGMHGRIYVVLKESLKRIPVIGWGMQFSQFIFLKRKWEQDKPRMAAHLQKFNNPKDPMWLMMFPEGTNLADSTREASRAWAEKNGIHDMKHTLLPRSTGLQFILQQLRDTVEYVYDCTIAYEGVSRGEFAQDIFTVGASYLGGHPPKSVNMYWRRFRVSAIPLDNATNFELWLRQRWAEKDKFIEDYLRTGRFPADKGSSKDSKGKTINGAGHIEAEIKPKYWYEFLQVFAPIGLFALVLYMFYGALPTEVLNKIKSVDQRTVLRKIAAYQRGEIKIPDQEKLKAEATKALRAQQKLGGSQLRDVAVAHGLVTMNGKHMASLPAKGLAGQTSDVGTKPKASSLQSKSDSKAPAKAKPVTLNGKPLANFPAKGLKGQTEKEATKPKKLDPKAKPRPKAVAKSKAVTLNGKPLSDFPTKGLEQAAGISEVAAAKLVGTKTNANPNAYENQPITGTTSKSVPLGKTKIAPAITKMPKATHTKQAPKPASKPTDAAPKAASLSTYSEPKKPIVKPNAGATLTKPVTKPKAPSIALTATSSVPPEEEHIESAEVRKAQKKLELRQGKQQPKRKTRRVLERSAPTLKKE